MPALEAVNDRQARKRELLLESELNRKVLQIELGQWQLQTTRWHSRFNTFRLASVLALPALRIFLSRQRPARPRSSVISALWRFVVGR